MCPSPAPSSSPRCIPAAGSAEDIDAGGALSGYTVTIVRDGYADYHHLADVGHAWCGAHRLRDLKDLYEFDRGGQVWARSMADLLIDANKQATGSRRRAGPPERWPTGPDPLRVPRRGRQGHHR